MEKDDKVIKAASQEFFRRAAFILRESKNYHPGFPLRFFSMVSPAAGFFVRRRGAGSEARLSRNSRGDDAVCAAIRSYCVYPCLRQFRDAGC